MRLALYGLVLLCLALARASGAQPVRSEDDARNVASNVLRQIAPHLVGTRPSIRREAYPLTGYDVWWVEGEQGVYSLTIRAADGATTSFVDYVSESEVTTQGQRQVLDRRAATEFAARILRALSPSFTKFSVLEYRSPGPDGSEDPGSPLIELRMVETAGSFGGYINEAAITLDAFRSLVLFVNVADNHQFSPPGSTLGRDEAVGALRAAWNAEAPHYERPSTERFPWPGDEVCRTEATMFAYPPAGARSFTSDYGEQLERDRKVRVCWVFGSGRLRLAVDAENGRLARSDLSKQASQRPEWPGHKLTIEEIRENLRRAADKRRAAALKFWGGVLVIVAATIGLYLWRRQANKSVLD